jgi:hypothetical protein
MDDFPQTTTKAAPAVAGIDSEPIDHTACFQQSKCIQILSGCSKHVMNASLIGKYKRAEGK